MNKKNLIRTLIVDDEPLARKKIRRFLENETDIFIIGEYKNGHEAVEAIRNLHPDLVFLDIHMPELDGIAVLQQLKLQEMPLVVFVTAYDQYAIKAFELHALDYLLKPFNRSRFQTTLSRARDTLQKENPSAGFHSLLAFLEDLKKKNDYLKRLMVKNREKVVVLDIEEIKWMESNRNYIDLHTGSTEGMAEEESWKKNKVMQQSNKDRTYRIRETLQSLETRLDPEKFVRINRSTIINIAFIKEMQPMFKKEYVVIFKTGERFILNKKYYSHLESIFKK